MSKKKLTRKQAKALSLEMWEYLRDHPSIKCKEGLPDTILREVKHLFLRCPLCDLYFKDKLVKDQCRNCPLNKKSNDYGCMGHSFDDFYNNWCNSRKKGVEVRRKAASGIVELIKKWKV